MRRAGKKSFFELVQQNKQDLLKDEKAMERIEERLVNKYTGRPQ